MSTIKTGTTTTTGLIVEADTSGNLVVQTGATPTTALTISGTNQQITPAAPISMVGGYGFRNKIINGNFDVWQRGTSQTSSGYGSADRWFNQNAGSTKTASQQAFDLGQTDVPGNPKYFMRHVVTSVAGASSFVITSQRIEGVETLSGKTVTLSFWAKADASKNIAVEFQQSFGTGGSSSTRVDEIGSQLVALTTSWAKYTITVDIPSVSGKTLGTDGNDYLAFLFWFDAGSDFDDRAANLGQQSGTFDIAQVQLEEGSAATPFELRPLGAELSLCQRYYYRVDFSTGADAAIGQIATTTTARMIFYFPVSLRSVTAELETSGTASNYTIRALSSSIFTCTALPAVFGTGTVNNKLATFTVASGLVAGQACSLRAGATTFLAWNAEL